MREIEERFEQKIKRLGKKENQIREALKLCSWQESQALKCLYAAMPISDGADYPVSLFVKFAAHGAYLWEKGPFAGKIPSEIFAGYVLLHRVNNEDLVEHRRFFYEKVKDLVVGKTLEEAALAINYWCAAQVTYRSTDERTANPISVYQAGYGRCGEESVFVVSVLRSVGIPARQVYAPWWSHCDDNHAWVEVWCEGAWKFLGACEPEEILNKGWFLNASSRAMMVHANWMLPGKPQKELAGKNGIAWMSNQLSRYAKTAQVKVQVLTASGIPAVGIPVDAQVLNYAEFRTIAQMQTDEKGEVELETGYGSLLVTAVGADSEKEYGEVLIDTRVQTNGILQMQKAQEVAETWMEFPVYAPKDAAVNVCEETAQQVERGRKKLMEAVRIREAKEQKENRQIQDFLEKPSEEKYPQEWRSMLLESLREKDRREISAELLEEICRETEGYGTCSEEIFQSYLLCPRVKNEKIRPFRTFLKGWLSEEEKETLRQRPEQVVPYVEERIKEEPEWEYADLITSAKGAFESGCGSCETKKIAAVQILRTLGIPARLNPMDEQVEFWREGRFQDGGKDPGAKLVIANGKGDGWKSGQNWTIARRESDGYRTLHPEQEQKSDWSGEISLFPGAYRILTANRLPNGNSLCKKLEVTLREGEVRRIELERAEAKIEEMRTDYQLETFSLTTLEGSSQKSSRLFGKEMEEVLFLWLDVGKEPTEHILNEIYEQREQFDDRRLGLCFLIKMPEDAKNPTLQRTIRAVKNGQIFLADFDTIPEMLARRVYQEPGQFPLILLVDHELRCIYGTSGYNVGTADMILKLSCGGKKNKI